MQYLPQWLAPIVSQRFLEQEQNNELWYRNHQIATNNVAEEEQTQSDSNDVVSLHLA